MSALVSAGFVRAFLPKLRVLDCSWFLPGSARSGRAEYSSVGHIPGAVFFDIDAVADASSGLPHMLPPPAMFEQAVSDMGISNDSIVVAYDSQGVFSAARVWFTFRYFGHEQVVVLNGGLPAWLKAGFPLETETTVPSPPKQSFRVQAVHSEWVAQYDDVVRGIADGSVAVVDARPAPRYQGLAPEPRPTLLTGHMPNSVNVPWSSLWQDPAKPELGLAPLPELQAKLQPIVERNPNIITSCGSGLSACVVNLALHEIGLDSHVRLYDGSWSEYGNRETSPVERGGGGDPVMATKT